MESLSDPGACLRGEVVSARFMAGMIPIDLHGLVELPYLVGIFATKVTGKHMKFQLPPPEEAQPVIGPV